MFRDCFRCGHGWRTRGIVPPGCPLCSGMTDEQAKFVLEMQKEQSKLRSLGRKLLLHIDVIEYEQFKPEELMLLGIYV